MKKILLIFIIFLSVCQINVVFSTSQSNWYLSALNYNPNQITHFNKNNVSIALIDSGINTNNRHLWTNNNEVVNNIDDDNNGKIDDIHGWNFVNNTNNVTDLNGHGTLMTSLITNINEQVSIMPLKVLDREGNLVSLDLMSQALEYAIHEQVNIIVIAIYVTNVPPTISSLIAQAQTQNIAVITDSGNYGTCTCNDGKTNALSTIKGVLTIGAIEQNMTRASYSQYGTNLDLMAPGIVPFQHETVTGTSVATGLASGVYSVLAGVTSNITKIKIILERTATDLNQPSWDEFTGYGLINVSLALETILDKEPPIISTTGATIKITDNVGIFSIVTPNQTIFIQGQNRSIALKRLSTTPYDINAQDLAGNQFSFTVYRSKQANYATGMSIVVVFSLISVLRKYKKKNEK